MSRLRNAFGACCIGVAAVAVACAADVGDYRTALDANGFEEYRIVTAGDDTRRRQQQSLGNFDEDVLVGDFNFDGSEDFAAILSRSATEAEIERTYFPPGQDAVNQRTFLAVVCNGVAEAATTGRYRCMQLPERMVGGFGGELTILDPGEWGEDLSTIGDAAGNPQCPLAMPSFSNRLLLALDEPVGRCTTYYYPNSDGTYGRCIYCAD